MNEVMPQPIQPITQEATAGVYRSLNAETGVIGEMHIGDVESQISSTVGEHAGAAMLNAESYVDPSARGALYDQHFNAAAVAAAQNQLRQDSLNLFGGEGENADDDEDELVGARN